MKAAAKPSVYIVDDEAAVREGLSWLMQVEGLPTRLFATAEDFLNACIPEMRGCVLLDIRLPDLSGLEVQKQLEKRAIHIPIIFLTGHGDVPMSRQAFRSGAVDFLQKPCSDQILLERVHEALELDASRSQQDHHLADIRDRYERLSRREKQIMALVIVGKSSREIATELFISNRTVEVHRAHIMEKLQAESLTRLIAIGYELKLIENL